MKKQTGKAIKDIVTAKKIAILGFGLEGRDVLAYLLETGSKAGIGIFDRKTKEELDPPEMFNKPGIKYFVGKDYDLSKISDYDLIIRSPGIYRYLPEINEAEKKGIDITSPVELFFEKSPAKIIGVTGTKGKGTTSTLIYEILKASGQDVYLAGNIGKPVLALLPDLTPNKTVVLELSSFQLIDLRISPHISVVLNITTDHLDWHKDRAEYVDAKKSILRFQNKDDFAVINADYDTPKSFADIGNARKIFFSRYELAEGVCVKDAEIILNIAGDKHVIGKTSDLLLRGEHNWENITAAIAAGYLAGSTPDGIRKAVYSFKGLEHRLELVGKRGGVAFYNDSFSTNPQTTIAAIKSFDEPMTVIAGGFNKNLDYTEMASEFKKSGKLLNVILIGDIREIIRTALLNAGYKGNIVDMEKRGMNEVVSKAAEITPPGGVVLLSPATSSFDMFENYKVRGLEFKKAVYEFD